MSEALSQELERIIARHRAGELEAAEAGYREILAGSPDSARVLGMLGVLLHQKGEGEEALRLLERAETLDPADPDLRNNRGNVLKELGRFSEAEAAYRSVLEIAPDHARAMTNLGVCLREQGQAVEAEATQQRALELDPSSYETLNNLGNVLRDLGRLDEAAACFMGVLVTHPTMAEAYASLGNTFQEQGDTAKALQAFRKVGQVAPDTALAHYAAGNAFALEAKLEEAVAAYTRAVALKPDYLQAYNNMGNVLRGLGRLDEAIASYGKAVEIRPQHPDVYFNLAVAHADKQEVAEAARIYRKVLSLRPGYVDALRSLGFLHYRFREFDQAARVFDEWLEQEPGHPVATHMRAACSGEGVPDRCSEDYVRLTFDRFAKTFDEKLELLNYKGPELVCGLLAETLGEPSGDRVMLDAGCGTGLCGPKVRGYASRLVGVDLSPRMLEQAEGRGYDELIEADLIAFGHEHPGVYDVIISADTYVYFGNLREAMEAAYASLKPGGSFFLTLERMEAPEPGATFRLEPHGRYSQTEEYVREVMLAAGFRIHGHDNRFVRSEGGQPVRAHLLHVARPGESV